MELYQLKTFISVADERNLTRASERLNTSQPAVSAHIKALEEEFGVALFIRSKKGMQLTKEGCLLLPKAREILDSAGDLLNQAKVLQGKPMGNARIAVSSNSPHLGIMDFLGVMMAEYPGIDLHLVQSISYGVPAKLLKHECDAGFFIGHNPVAEIMTFRLCTVNLVIAGPAHMKEQIERSDLEGITRLPWVWQTACGLFHQFENEMFCDGCFKPAKSIIAEDEATMKALIIAGAGLGLMLEAEAIDMKKEGKIAIWTKEKLCADLSFVFLEKRRADPMIQAMVSSLQKVWQTVQNKSLGAGKSGGSPLNYSTVKLKSEV